MKTKNEIWKNTIDCHQRYYEANENSTALHSIIFIKIFELNPIEVQYAYDYFVESGRFQDIAITLQDLLHDYELSIQAERFNDTRKER